MSTMSDPVAGSAAITLADTDQTRACRGFHSNTTGNLKVTFAGQGTVTLAVTTGSYYPYRIIRFWSTGSDAITALALY